MKLVEKANEIRQTYIRPELRALQKIADNYDAERIAIKEDMIRDKLRFEEERIKQERKRFYFLITFMLSMVLSLFLKSIF